MDLKWSSETELLLGHSGNETSAKSLLLLPPTRKTRTIDDKVGIITR